MINTIQPAGFIVVDTAAIWGVGSTEDAAWADLRDCMRAAHIPHISEIDEEDTYAPKTWSEEGFKAVPATAALIAEVQAHGGLIAHGWVGDVACTNDEEAEAEAEAE
jgi:hypothetical protein